MGLLAERAALREDAARLLDELGGTVSEVAVSLGSVGIQVQPSNSHDSPAAGYPPLCRDRNRQPGKAAIKVNTLRLVLKTH